MSEQFCVIEPITVTGATLVSNNVPETDYTEYSPITSYALDDYVRVTSEHNIYKSLAATNVGNTPATSPTKWVLVGKTNAWAMLDGQVNTQTTNADSIVLAIAPGDITQGVCLMNVDADSVTLTVTDLVDGLVYTSTVMADKANSGSSFYDWFFKRIHRRRQFAWTDLPPYWGATINITINKPGSVAKCGMVLLGPLERIGYTKYGLSPSIKDYSTNLFDQFGNLTTVNRPWAKELSVDVMVHTDSIDYLVGLMVEYRRPVAWVASTLFESTVLYAKYVDFKAVIPNVVVSDCSLKLQGLI